MPAEDYGEPWRVSHQPIKLSFGRKLHNAIVDKNDNMLGGDSPQVIKRFNDRVVACVNALEGISNQQLNFWRQSTLFDLMRAVLSTDPEEHTPKRLLLDELTEILNAYDTEKPYVSRNKLLDLLVIAALCLKTDTNQYREIIKAIGVPCQAGIFWGGTRYPCEKGKMPDSTLTPHKCPVCSGYGLVLPIKSRESLTESRELENVRR